MDLNNFIIFKYRKKDIYPDKWISNFVTYDTKESLLLRIAKSNHEFVENTHSKPQETLEFKMTKRKESFSFDISLELPEHWMMAVTSLEVFNTVFNTVFKAQ